MASKSSVIFTDQPSFNPKPGSGIFFRSRRVVSATGSQRIDPRGFVKAEAVGIFWFLFLRWAVIAQTELFVDFRGVIFNDWANAAASQILEVDAPMPPLGIPPA